MLSDEHGSIDLNVLDLYVHVYVLYSQTLTVNTEFRTTTSCCVEKNLGNDGRGFPSLRPLQGKPVGT